MRDGGRVFAHPAHGNAVLMSKDDDDALTETAYLLRNPVGAERLLSAIERARRGETEQHEGIGKPEPLKHVLSGAWSRRIDQSNRLVYYVSDDQIVILQARDHY